MKKEVILAKYIRNQFDMIRSDWSDPRWNCREGWEAADRLLKLLEEDTKVYRYGIETETDEEYYKRISQPIVED